MNIGLLGCGTIGGGVLAMVDELKSPKYIVKKVFDIPQKKEVLGERYSDNIDDICAGKDIDIVVEAMGGDEFPYKCIKKALENGKSVVTSNKEVVSRHMVEFYELAKKNNTYFMCEASVGGGIPLICTLIESTKSNNIDHIYGIINGTTNFILTKMDREGMSFDNALKLAQELGFAEKDPTADLEGLDMTRKICILSSIAYKGYISPDVVYHRGIKNITLEILNDIKSKGYILKFVAESKLDGNNLRIGVEPVLLPLDNPIGGTNYEYNAVYYDGDRNGTLGLYGKGAGRFPTATAMVNDIIRISENGEKYFFEKINNYTTTNHIEGSSYYVYDGKKGEIVRNINEEKIAQYVFVARMF